MVLGSGSQVRHMVYVVEVREVKECEGEGCGDEID